MHPQFRPDRAGRKSATEFDVWSILRALGHTVEIAAAEHDLRQFDRLLADFKPDIVFNLLEEFRGEAIYDFHLVTYLESLGVPYTGCNPRGLIVSRNKLWSAHIASGEGLRAPPSRLVRPRELPQSYPVFLKYNREHASLGVTRSNVVRDRVQFQRSMGRLRGQFGGEVVAQAFVPGREVTVSVWGNQKPEAFSPWCLNLPDKADVVTSRVKFSAQYRRKKGIRATRFRGEADRILRNTAKRLYGLFDMNGYARFDFRLDSEGVPFLIDVNANPCLAKDEDFAISARAQGYEYGEMVERIVQLGLEYRPRL